MAQSRRDFIRSSGILAGGAIAGAAEKLLAAQEGADGGKSYRACVIGHTGRGDYGHSLDVCFQKIPGVTVQAVADPAEKGRQAALRRIGAERSYADWREMLEKEKPDLVSIGSRFVDDRLAMVRAAAEAGASIFMEKPIAASLEEADAIVAVAEKRGIRIAVALHALVAPSIARLKALLSEGLIGDLLEMRSRGKEDNRAGGEDMMVLGTHCMYLMRYFAGEALWCSARVLSQGREITADDARAATEPLGPVAGDSIHASYAFAGGIQGHFASQKTRQGSGGRFGISLHGSKGVAMVHIGMDPEVHYLADPLWSPGKSKARWEPLPPVPAGASTPPDSSGLTGAEGANRRIVLDLIRAVGTGGQPAASVGEARAALEMILGVYASHLSGSRATFPLKDRRHPLIT